LLNAAVAAFAHRAIAERNPEALASEALSYIAAGLEADRVDRYVLSADGRFLELRQRFPAPREVVAETLPVNGSSVAAEALARGEGVVVRPLDDGEGYSATAVASWDVETCVFVAYAYGRPFAEEARTGLDAIAAMYAAAMARCYTEAQLADRERRFRLILNAIPAIVSTLDTDLVFTSVQGARLADMIGDETTVIGRKLADVGAGETSVAVMAARNVLAGFATQFEMTWRGRIYENRMEPLRDTEGRVIGAINLGIDVTEKRRAEAELRASREELRRLSAAMNQIQENERRRIAREIHDDLGQRLTALRLDLGLVRGELRDGHTAGAEARIRAMIGLVDETLTTARRLARELRPAVLDDFGFAAAVEHEVESFARRTNIEVALRIEPEGFAIEPERATALFRVIQEALTNVARHSGASHVDVRVEDIGRSIEVEVRDDGRGIAAEELHNPGGLGLTGIRERIFAFDGVVSIEAAEGGGTRVRVTVPK